MKKIWMTSLISSQDSLKRVLSEIKKYGLEAGGHFWEDNLEKMSWNIPRESLIDPKIALWGILATEEALLNPAVRYGLSLLAITVQAQRGLGFPVVILQTEGNPISNDDLPMPLKGAIILSAKTQGFGAKLVAKVHSRAETISSEYHIDIYGIPHIGQWFEIGPQNTSWKGVVFGVTEAEITFHAVGPKGNLPEKSVVHYSQKGLKLSLKEKEYTAWAVQNELDSDSSYFIKVEGFPNSIVFGPYSTDDEAEMYCIELK